MEASTAAPLPPQTLLEHTVQTAPLKVIYSTAAFGFVGALSGSALGVTRNVPAIPAAFQTGINTAVFSFTFFSIREYLVHPLLCTLNLRPSPLVPPSSLPNLHTQNLGSTALAGLFAGSAFSYFARGSAQGNIRAAGTLALGCTFVQVMMNEGEGLRIRALAWGEERQRRLDVLDARADKPEPIVAVREIPSFSRSIENASPSVESRETFSERSDRLVASTFGSLTETLARLSPMKKMDDKDYEATLTSRLAVVQAARAELAREIEELKKAKGV